MLEQLTYAQIGERLNVSSDGARAIVKRNRLPRSHDKNGKTLVAIDLDELRMLFDLSPAAGSPIAGRKDGAKEIRALFVALRFPATNCASG